MNVKRFFTYHSEITGLESLTSVKAGDGNWASRQAFLIHSAMIPHWSSKASNRIDRDETCLPILGRKIRPERRFV